MSIGPLRRLSGALGLVAMTPIAVTVATGQVSVVDAAIRAVVTLATVLVLARVVHLGMAHVAATLEAASEPDDNLRAPRTAAGTTTPRPDETDVDEGAVTQSERSQAVSTVT